MSPLSEVALPKLEAPFCPVNWTGVVFLIRGTSLHVPSCDVPPTPQPGKAKQLPLERIQEDAFACPLGNAMDVFDNVQLLNDCPSAQEGRKCQPLGSYKRARSVPNPR